MYFRKSIIIIFSSILIFFCICICKNIIKDTVSISDSISDDNIIENINKLNNVLKNKVEINNPYFLEEIVDENGKVPAYKYYKEHQVESMAIAELKYYDNKIFIGVGDYSNDTGPVKMIFYNTLTEKIESSGTIPDNKVMLFNEFDGELYTAGTDPIGTGGIGGYYVYDKEKNSWKQNLFYGDWIHVYDVAKINGKIYVGGSVSGKTKSVVQVSEDNGQTFRSVFLYNEEGQVPNHSNMRCYRIVEYQGNIYARVYNHDNTSYRGTGLYKYNPEEDRFELVGQLTYMVGNFTFDNAVYTNSYHFNNRIFKDNLIFIAGNLYKMNISNDNKIFFESIKIGSVIAVQDAVVAGDNMYILTYVHDKKNSIVNVQIYKTNDLKNFDVVYEYSSNTIPIAIEYHDDILYIGTGYSNHATIDVSKTGTLYKIDLKKMIPSLDIDSEKKIINVNKDNTTSNINYSLTKDRSEFNTILTFNKNMTKKQWEQEYTKFKNLNLIYSLFHSELKIDLNETLPYYDNIIDSNILLSENSSSSIDFAKKIFGSGLNIVDKRFSIKSEIINSSEDEYKVSITLSIPNLIKVTSDTYSVSNMSSYIYVGNETDAKKIKENIKYDSIFSVEVDINANKINLFYGESLVKQYNIIRFVTEREINNKKIYMSNFNDSEILNTIEVINGKKIIKDDKIQLIYKEDVLDEFKIMSFNSDKIKIFDNNVYIGAYSIKEIKDIIETKNVDVIINNNKIEILNEDKVYETFNILNIYFVILSEKDKKILIPKKYLYNNLINNIICSVNIEYKIFDNDKEITDGLIEENIILKKYYNNNEIDSFNFKKEYLLFDASIIVDEENNYLYNIEYNTSVVDLLSKINTSGNILIKNNKELLLNDSNLVGTGSKVSVEFLTNNVNYYIIIKGDINGNGNLDFQDVLDIANYIYADEIDFDDIYIIASDYDNNGLYNLEDIMKPARKLVGGA